MMKHDLIEISELGQVSVLGVHIGMNKNLAKRILAPERCLDWELSEGRLITDKIRKPLAICPTLTVDKYYKDNKLVINFVLENDEVNFISIARTNPDTYEEFRKVINGFRERLINAKLLKKEKGIEFYGTGFCNLELHYVKQNTPKSNKAELLVITEEKYEDFINKKFNEKDFEDKTPRIGCVLMYTQIICGAILLFNIVDIFDFLGSVDRSVVSFIVIFVLFVVCIAYTVVDRKKETYFYKNTRLQKNAIEFVRGVKEHGLLREREIQQDIMRYENALKQSNDAWIKEQEALYQQKQKQLSDERTMQRYEHNNKMQLLLIKESTYEDMLKGSLFKRSASLYADYKVLEIDAIETYLRTKKSPMREGSSTAEELKKLKQSKREDVARYKEMLYKWEFLMNLFPELSKYVDDENDIQDLESYDGIDDFKENYDRARDYLTEDEYRSLSVDERNQRALDLWKCKRKPSKWIAGVEYEMYCAYVLRKKGFYVIEHGIQKGLNDLGIDLIAKQGDTTYIIQCKRYSNAMVHENTICQLFGTTLKYKIDNINLFDANITPLLLTTGELTDTAKEFANKLGVMYKEWLMGEYPMIKCNINNSEKIYHLPFDQQYWRTIIEPEKGEFYAMTVKEATQAGFRRAFKHRSLGNE